MRIRIVKSFVSAAGVRNFGDVLHLPAAEATALLEGGLAERLPDEPERAVRSAPERAGRRRSRRR